MTDRPETDLLAELQSLGDMEDGTQTDDAPVGQSETARQLDKEGYFNQLGERFFQERQQRDQRAVEDSQGFSESNIVRSVKDFFNRPPAPWRSTFWASLFIHAPGTRRLWSELGVRVRHALATREVESVDRRYRRRARQSGPRCALLA